MSRSSVVGISVGILLVVVVQAVYSLRPWLAGPRTDMATIDARWAEVERRAASLGAGPPSSPELAAATTSLRGWTDIGAVLGGDATAEPIARERLAAPAREAIAGLVRWSEGGGEVRDGCMNTESNTVGLSMLAKLTLRSATGPDASFVAVLRLARGLRRHGPLIDGAVGFHAAEMAAEIAALRGWDARAVLTEFRPTAEELRAVVARESVCLYRTVSATFGEGCSAARVPWYVPVSAKSWCEREKAVVRERYGELHAVADAEADLRRFADALATPEDESSVEGMALHAVSVVMTNAVREMIERMDRYDAALAKLP